MLIGRKTSAMDYQHILDKIAVEVNSLPITGKVASYIPELATVKASHFGVHLHSIDESDFHIGEHQNRFSIQSISKVFTLALALKTVGPKVWERLDVEPSGDPFNSLVQLEYEKGIPRNPFINAGALVISDILISAYKNPKEELLNFIKKLASTETIEYDDRVAASEIKHSHRNASLVNLMKSFGNIENDVDKVLDFYCNHCAIAMSCEELSKTFMLFVNNGKVQQDGEQILNPSTTKRINAIMLTCGFYDESGEFAFRVGIPGKSGVGGGIVAIHPEKYSVAVWSPPLNEKGNSELGMHVLELLTTHTGSSVF